MRTEENPQCHPRDPRVIRVQWIVHKVHDGAHQAQERELGLLTNTHSAERAGRIGVDYKRAWRAGSRISRSDLSLAEPKATLQPHHTCQLYLQGDLRIYPET